MRPGYHDWPVRVRLLSPLVHLEITTDEVSVENLEGIAVHRISTAQQVADGLTELILSGRISPGAPIRESAVALQLGISRNTVREAVRILEQGGLVRRTDMHKGASVVEPSADELRDLHAARKLLELAGAAATTSPESVKEVRAAFDALVHASTQHELELMVARDLEFHTAIVRQLGNARLDAFYEQLTRELRFYLMVLSVEDNEYEEPAQVIEEHQAVIEAIETKATKHAQQLLAGLIDASEIRVTAIFHARLKT